MSTKELVEYFMQHSPGFHEDLSLAEIDDKHTNILSEAYQQIKDGKAFTRQNFRNWKQQSDLGIPVQISSRAVRENGLAHVILRYLYTKLFRYRDDKLLHSALLDDIEIIKLQGGEELLVENPVHLSLGATNSYNTGGTSVNFRWLRYVYLLKRILDQNLLPDGSIWVDVGSYYGGLQGLVKKYNPGSRLVLVDFHHQLCRSYIYLSHHFPDAKHVMPDQLSDYKNLGELSNDSIVYLPVTEYDQIENQTVDLVTNCFSLGEMRREFFNRYMNSRLFRESKHVYTVNRVVSAPFFEKTYDSDISILDYIPPDRNIEYFDLFPMHHYLLIKRVLFGRESLRNVSSPYFEMLTSLKVS